MGEIRLGQKRFKGRGTIKTIRYRQKGQRTELNGIVGYISRINAVARSLNATTCTISFMHKSILWF